MVVVVVVVVVVLVPAYLFWEPPESLFHSMQMYGKQVRAANKNEKFVVPGIAFAWVF